RARGATAGARDSGRGALNRVFEPGIVPRLPCGAERCYARACRRGFTMKRAKIHWTLVSTLTLVLAQGGTGCLGERRPKPRAEQKADVPDAGATVEAVSLEGIDDAFTKLVEGGERKQVLYGREHPQKGAAQPLVTIVEFSDFQCPFCGRLAGSLDQLLADDPD